MCAIADAIIDIEETETSEEQDEETDDDIVDEVTDERDIVSERKSICFEENIMELARIHISSKCNRKKCDKIVGMDTRMIGSCFRITWVNNNYFITMSLELVHLYAGLFSVHLLFSVLAIILHIF